jgi:hypothetical protein
MKSLIVPTVGVLRRLLPALVVLAALPLVAQTAPEKPKEEDVVILSPFTVQTAKDVGYEASESLSGTGLRTKLTDLGAAVSVITAKFLEDTGSFNLRDVLGSDITDDGLMYAGFTASTGLADTTHQLSAWALDDDTGSCAPPHWHLGGYGSGGYGSGGFGGGGSDGSGGFGGTIVLSVSGAFTNSATFLISGGEGTGAGGTGRSQHP